MERKIEWEQHDYLATPWEYPITDNVRPATYDQFITLRDTLVYSNKYYGSSAWRSLIIWTKLDGTPTNTIEIREPNLTKMYFEPDYESNPWDLIKDETEGQYTSTSNVPTANPLSCIIKKDWRYRISHKEQFVGLANTSITRVHTLVRQHTSTGTVTRAAFDWEWSTAWMMNRVTSFGFVECNLSKWDWLELLMLDQNDSDISSSLLQASSNWWHVEYIDLAY